MKKQIFLGCMILSIVLFSGCLEQPLETNTNNESGLGSNTSTTQESSEEISLVFNEWTAPDNSITLQVPEGWTAAENQVDTCTVSWTVTDSTSTISVYMLNQIMVFKSEDAKQIYKTYGLAGADNVPVSKYLDAESASSQIIAPLSNSTNLQVIEYDSELTPLFSQGVCIQGLAACDAKVFEANYENNNTQMRGKYFVQTLDLGDGYTWWINIWGYTSPTNQWEQSKDVLEKIFTSVKYTDKWKSECKTNTDTTSNIINEVIKKRQESADEIAKQWE